MQTFFRPSDIDFHPGKPAVVHCTTAPDAAGRFNRCRLLGVFHPASSIRFLAADALSHGNSGEQDRPLTAPLIPRAVTSQPHSNSDANGTCLLLRTGKQSGLDLLSRERQSNIKSMKPREHCTMFGDLQYHTSDRSGATAFSGPWCLRSGKSLQGQRQFGKLAFTTYPALDPDVANLSSMIPCPRLGEFSGLKSPTGHIKLRAISFSLSFESKPYYVPPGSRHGRAEQQQRPG
ncbi:hypothetical protein CH63R_08547 [Colletotrichum higginsianum IMI 349063]|uniref:Uncharacterized protein n=1 Tax=Colletotrichum higginsianum (strain IMI 349063) TaxID=759273 RepID=A0A1B7Y4Y4_COLHI|nr:hypothetical protein CH63R_08547 [Colletotrichum higginsianum IMI 349063]OBR07026.1 hypothetical protein CH63R_08547 [Colletotrichum higginsianum IMI 349063]